MNNENHKKVMLIAPFWGKSNHVGVYRIDRFKRWLITENYKVLIVKGGNKDELQTYDWGLEITVSNSIDNITTKLIDFSKKLRTKFFLYVWNTLVSIFLVPDANRLWVRKIFKHSLVNDNIEDINLVLSSSPPNSSHIAAFYISQRLGIPLIIDMRDGWLDEPLHLSVKRWKTRERLERKWESRILRHANKIFVTSQIWKALLINRLEIIDSSVVVLTNAYPLYDFKDFQNQQKDENVNKTLRLLYAGKFVGSRHSNSMDLLLDPFLNSEKYYNNEIEITLLGELRRKDFHDLKLWKSYFHGSKCKILHKDRVSRIEMFESMSSSDGLLLLAASEGSIPSKTFEYIKSRKPILAVTSKGSAIWELDKDISQLFVFNYKEDKKDYDIINEFLNVCKTGQYEISVPEEYSERYLSNIFLRSIEDCVN